MFLGIESGSDLVLENMDKGSAVKFYGPSIKWLKEEGITTVGAFVVGFPGETKDTVAETTEFISRSGLDFFFLQPFYYLHHTPVYKVADKFGLKGKGLNWSHATMNAREASHLLDRMFLDIDGPVFVNPDYTLWEVAYLTNKGMSMDDIVAYRRTINAMTAAQMTAHGSHHAGSTSGPSTSRKPRGRGSTSCRISTINPNQHLHDLLVVERHPELAFKAAHQIQMLEESQPSTLSGEESALIVAGAG